MTTTSSTYVLGLSRNERETLKRRVDVLIKNESFDEMRDFLEDCKYGPVCKFLNDAYRVYKLKKQIREVKIATTLEFFEHIRNISHPVHCDGAGHFFFFKAVPESHISNITSQGLRVSASKDGMSRFNEELQGADKGKQFVSPFFYIVDEFYMDRNDQEKNVMLLIKVTQDDIERLGYRWNGETEGYFTKDVPSKYIFKVVQPPGAGQLNVRETFTLFKQSYTTNKTIHYSPLIHDISRKPSSLSLLPFVNPTPYPP